MPRRVHVRPRVRAGGYLLGRQAHPIREGAWIYAGEGAEPSGTRAVIEIRDRRRIGLGRVILECQAQIEDPDG